jgi:predicted nuclease with TOPRIM domain
MSTAERLKDLARSISDMRRERDQAQGRKEAALEALGKFGVKTLPAARKKIDQIKKEQAALEEELERGVTELEEMMEVPE